MKKIAVEEGLSNISQELQVSNYQVVDFNTDITEVDAIVISGEDNNTMNMSDIKTGVQIINAKGLSAAQVKKELKNRMIH